MSALVSHLESRLGHIQGGWKVELEGAGKGVTVGLFQGGRLERVSSFATVGLSEYPLTSRTSGRKLRMELIASSYGEPSVNYGPWPGILEHLTKVSVNESRPILRGDVIQLPGKISPTSQLDALYATFPVYFDEPFKSVDIGHEQSVAVVWLVPIGKPEADLVKTQGWRAFEDVLTSRDPDLLDLDRPLVA